MDVGATGAANTGTIRVTDASARAELSSDQFLSMLVAEMQNQDPLEPMDNGKLMGQLMQMQQLESSAALTDGINGLLQFQSVATGSSMIGQVVEGITDSGESITGVVEKVSMVNGDVRVVVDGQFVSLGNVQTVSSPAAQGA